MWVQFYLLGFFKINSRKSAEISERNIFYLCGTLSSHYYLVEKQLGPQGH